MIIHLYWIFHLRLQLNNFWSNCWFRFFVKIDILVKSCQQSWVQIIDEILQAVVLIIILLESPQVWVESKFWNVQQIWQNISQQIRLRLLLKLGNNW